MNQGKEQWAKTLVRFCLVHTKTKHWWYIGSVSWGGKNTLLWKHKKPWCLQTQEEEISWCRGTGSHFQALCLYYTLTELTSELFYDITAEEGLTVLAAAATVLTLPSPRGLSFRFPSVFGLTVCISCVCQIKSNWRSHSSSGDNIGNACFKFIEIAPPPPALELSDASL